MSTEAHQIDPTVEDAAIEQVCNVSLALLDTTKRPVPRGQHPKTLGCVRAEFVIEPDLPEPLKVGVFASPHTFPALVRFSNGHEVDDRKGDIHGVAIKLLGVEGQSLLPGERDAVTQDFLLADSPSFFLKDLSDYVRFSLALNWATVSSFGRIALLLRVLLGWRPPWSLFRKALSQKPDSPLRSWYWSQTPYALGSLEVKYALRPDLSLTPKPPDSGAKDRLRDALSSQLSTSEARFDFLVQTRTDPSSMPIEDASVQWDDTKAPFQKVATLRIPVQKFDFPEMWSFAEDLSFTPWHAISEHRPLGTINRARRVIYEAVSARRHECNDRPRREPEVSDIPNPP